MTESPTDAIVLLERGSQVTLTCGPMVHGGLCLSQLPDGTTVFVDAGIPGEEVVARLDYRKRKSWFATVVNVIKPSPSRVAPPCPYVPDCGGCQLQHIDYSEQLVLKQNIVLDAMRRQGVKVPEIEVIGMDDPWRYRWRGEFHVVRGEKGVADASLGFNRARSWTPIAVEDCLIHHHTISDSLPTLRQAVREGGRDDLSVLHLTVGEEGRELLIRSKPREALSSDVIDSVSRTAAVNWNTESTALHWRGRAFRVTPEAFIQVNWNQLDALYGSVLQGLGDVIGKRLVDAYAGAGVLATVLAESAAEVICIESNPHSVSLGLLNAQVNGVDDRVSFVGDTVESALAGVCAGDDVDAVILDPPRAGCETQVTGFLALAGPKQIVYVSCDPATLARDLGVLVSSGPYEITNLSVVDMFPQTYHVECVVVLQRS